MVKTIKKRRRQGKTDYRMRKGLLKSNKPRVIVRKTNKYIIVQFVTSKESKDKVEFGVTSQLLLKYGWPKNAKGSLKSVPAAYLIGYIAGKKIIEKEKGEVIFDLGLQRNISGGRLYAMLKGLVDSGVKIKHNKKIFPNDERIKGKYLKQNIEIEKIKSSI